MAAQLYAGRLTQVSAVRQHNTNTAIGRLPGRGLHKWLLATAEVAQRHVGHGPRTQHATIHEKITRDSGAKMVRSFPIRGLSNPIQVMIACLLSASIRGLPAWRSV